MASPPFSSTESAVTAKKGKSKGRKPSQAPVKKGKKRGMGVEALERLRTQEIQKWVNMRDAVTAAAAVSQLDQSGISRFPTTRFVEPGATIPVDYGEAGSKGVVSGWIKTTESATVAQFSRSGAAQYPTSHFEESTTLSVSKPQGGEVLGLPANIGGIWGWNGGMLMQKRAGNGGFSGGYTTDNGSGQYLGIADHPKKADGIPNFRAQFKNSVYETSQELYSMPNSQQYCLKEDEEEDEQREEEEKGRGKRELSTCRATSANVGHYVIHVSIC